MSSVPPSFSVSAHFRVILMVLAFFAGYRFAAAQQPIDLAPESIHPSDVMFRRQAVRRMVFDHDQAIPLSVLEPSKVVSFDLMHPELIASKPKAVCTIEGDTMRIVSSTEEAWSFRWMGGFNPFATYDVTMKSLSGTGACGMSFRDSEEDESGPM